MSGPRVRILTKSKPSIGLVKEQVSTGKSIDEQGSSSRTNLNKPVDLSVFQLKHESQARTFKLIDDRDWSIIDSEPISESQFFCDGNPSMSVISVLGSRGVGKSNLLNKIACKYAFETHCSPNNDSSTNISTNHLTRGIDIHVTHHRILLDCQPVLSHPISTDYSKLKFRHRQQHHSIDDPRTNSLTISLQLAVFLLATCDYIVIMDKCLTDSHLLQIIASALKILGEVKYKAKLVIFTEDRSISERKFRDFTNNYLGMGQIDRYFCDEFELISYISSYTSEKCDQFDKDPNTFTGRQWLAYSRKLWSKTIRDSLLFRDYAMQMCRSTTTTPNHSSSSYERKKNTLQQRLSSPVTHSRTKNKTDKD